MKLSALIELIREDLAATAKIGDENVATAAGRLADTLEPSLRLRILEVLGQAALELSPQLPHGHVEVRLAGQDPELVFVEGAHAPESQASEHVSARITLRLPASVKQAVETAAAREGISINTWLVRTVSRAASPDKPFGPGRHMSGYGRG
jgi:hypothetical protein